ncbi:Extradiol ring-cleavage dioxygenase, class III enzyme, subunit B [Chaetomidium leptoderma]|uniref:Extradiol ring-cleavage dioxygenase, class III enzyme, subunit B n=1 Tax=Chaetomidium leptoderma TaxID=669021 RepID=A0AAN6VRR0_9PEZI|nr:Extradiol ring-cleavage dioxygenase, class III enzyme, subunit B [Chaetomidium leptoderma]
MLGPWVLRYSTLFLLPASIVILALFLGSSSSLARSLPSLTKIKNYSYLFKPTQPSPSMPKAPVYFFSHGGPDVQYNTEHPVYPILQSIGKEITQKVKPKAVVVFSAHWQAESNEIHLNNAEKTDLIYDFYGFPPKFYKATFPNKGSPALASQILTLLSNAGIKAKGLKRGPDHGVFSGFNVAFSPEENPLNCPLVQVSLFKNEDPDAHYRLGQAVAALRDENIVIIGTGMTVHNLRDMGSSWGNPKPLPYSVSFDKALKEAVEADPAVRQERMAAVTKRPDARQAHPWMDHLMPAYVAAGAAGEDKGVQTWTLHESSFAWGQYRFGKVPA